MSNNYKIKNGPCRSELIDAFKYAYDKKSHVVIDFDVAWFNTVSEGDPRNAYKRMPISDIRISGISYEDGSGNKFNLNGYCLAVTDSFKTASMPKPRSFKAFYDAQTREGWIEFER